MIGAQATNETVYKCALLFFPLPCEKEAFCGKQQPPLQHAHTHLDWMHVTPEPAGGVQQ